MTISEQIYSVVQREGDGYRTTPMLQPMGRDEAFAKAKSLKQQYPHASFVVLAEVGETAKDETVTVQPISSVAAADVPMRLPRRLHIASGSSAP